LKRSPEKSDPRWAKKEGPKSGKKRWNNGITFIEKTI